VAKKQRERRKRGEGGIYPIRKNGKIVRYAAAVDLGVIDGTRRRKVIYGETESEVGDELTKLRADLLRGLDINPEKLTLNLYLAAWLKSVELTKSYNTLRNYRNAVKHILKYLSGHLLRGLKAEHVELLMTELRDAGLKEGTRKAIRAALITALNQAVERDYLTKNVAKQVESPRVRRGKVRAFTDVQVSRLAQAARGHYLGPMIQVSLRLGLRSGEVRALLWADVDYDAMTIRIAGSMQKVDGKQVRLVTKTEDSETIMPLPPGLVAIFKAQWKAQQTARERADEWNEQGLIFTDATGLPLDGSTLAQAFKELARKANLPPHATFHGCRHTCAAMLIKRGAQPRQVMEVMRHKSIRTTMDVYGHMYPEVTRSTVNDLDRDLDQLAAGGEA
jgi:integrase